MTREQWSRLKARQAQYRRAGVLRKEAKTLWHRAKGVNPKSPRRAALMARVDVLGQQAAALWPADQPNPEAAIKRGSEPQ